MKGQCRLWLLACIVAALVAGCGCGGGDEGGPAATAVTLVAIQVTPANASIAIGTTQQFTATGIYSDKTTKDITVSVTWSSTDTSVAIVSDAEGSKGSAQSLSAGSTFIVAKSGNISGSGTLTVTQAVLTSITVTPAHPAILPGKTQQFTATGTFSDNSTQDITSSVTWSSSVPTIASVSNETGSKGIATGLAAGSTTIIATSGNITGSATLTVTQVIPPTLISLKVTPVNPAIIFGATQQFTATGTFSDNTTMDITSSVTWSSSAPAIASISNAEGSKGLATSLASGSTMITATSGNISDSTTLTVRPVLVAINVTPVNPIVHFNVTVQFFATGVYSDKTTQDITTVVTWSSSDTTVATISNAPGSQGLATTDHLKGNTIITATLGNISGSTNLIDP